MYNSRSFAENHERFIIVKPDVAGDLYGILGETIAQNTQGGYTLLGSPEDALKGVYLFEGLSADRRQTVADLCRFRDFDAHDEIVSYKDESTELYFVLNGVAKAKIYSAGGKVVGLREIAQGDVFGEFSAIDNAPRSASVEAATRCNLAAMEAEDFRQLLVDEPQVAQALNRHLVKQLRVLTTRVFEYTTLAVNNRIQSELLRLVREEGVRADDHTGHILIEHPPTDNEFATRISTHREAVARHRAYLTERGVLKKCGRTLVITNFELLRQMVRDATGE